MPEKQQGRRNAFRAHAGTALALLLATLASPHRHVHAQIAPEYCLLLIPPILPADDKLMREFEDLLREEFEQYLSEVTRYFRCLDDERDRALREAAQVTAQYGTFLDSLRRAPP
ncbi:hypothetical protein [Roseinatronobacter alkalisoli]|uniref:hypothetical protein n=1 Tax=Roseinatronobacter alkalisoli TaxID=3028235 RepID=UPI002367A773|nr:hypothetical protein [Roseinatronobacter sp. HJB301]